MHIDIATSLDRVSRGSSMYTLKYNNGKDAGKPNQLLAVRKGYEATRAIREFLAKACCVDMVNHAVVYVFAAASMSWLTPLHPSSSIIKPIVPS